MKKVLLLTLTFALFVAFGFSQTGKYWSPNSENRDNIVKYKAANSPTFPKEFKLFNLNITSLRQELMKVADNAVSHTTVISLPNADGQIEDFEVVEASNFDPALQIRYPQIRAFSGRGITDRTASLKISICPAGIQTMVFRAEKACEFIEKYSLDQTVYAVFKSQRKAGQSGWSCFTKDQETAASLASKITSTSSPLSSTGQLKTMRLAQSCNGEYATYFMASTAGTPADYILVYGGINATLARCNGVYEKDLGVHLNLIAGNDPVVYFNPATDPYSTNLNNWNGELQGALTTNIGEANYDIGHMFGASGGGGNAGCIGCVCVNGQKGSGITSPGSGGPEGDNFDIDYVVHEVGHQMGANHTYSFQDEGTSVLKEVGSGVTIMGYAGITPWDLAPHSIDIYHEASIAQIQTNLATKTCPVTTNIAANNATPVVDPLTNYTIPISTPFALTGSATDADAADVLTYCFEQNDNTTVFDQTVSLPPATNPCNAKPSKATGPNWLSWLPTTTPTRICPKLATVLAGGFTTAQVGGDANMLSEALSSVGRTLHFRLTVRDNHPYSSTAPVAVGQTAFQDMTVTVTNTSGPFKITVPNTNVSWQAGSTQTVTWDVANSTAAPVSCANVKISLSVDGGFTWPYVLSATTANDGTESVTLPSIPATTTARVKVESIGNIFFDIDDANFTLTAPTNGFSFNSVTGASVACAGATSADITLATTVAGTFVTPIVLTASGNPTGTMVTFTPPTINPGSSSTVTMNGLNTLPAGTYNITVTGTAGTVIQTATLAYTIQPGTPPAFTTQPTAVSVCSGANASFTVASSTPGVTYQWQVQPSTGGPFTDIAGQTSATYSFAPTQADNGNQYHCVITYLCGTATSNNAALTVNTAANITAQPTSFTACAGANHTFSVTATGTNVTYQWQVSVGGPFNNISGETNPTLILNNVDASMNGNQYQVVISATGSACPAPGVSNTVTLTVNPLPTTAAIAAVTEVCSGVSTTLTASGATTYSWTATGGTIASPNSAVTDVTPVVDPANPSVPNTITYTVIGTSLGCSSTQTVTVTANPLPAVTLVASPSITMLTLPSQVVTLTANVIPAGSAYTYLWTQNGIALSNNTPTQSVDVASVGEYDVTVSINGACASTSDKFSIVDSIPDQFFVYPNPNDGRFTIQVRVPNKIGNVTVFDSKGARVFAQVNITDRPNAFQVISVDLRPANSGVYVLVIYDKSGVQLVSQRIIVQH